MAAIYVAMEHGLLILRGANGSWKAEQRMEDTAVRCLASDPAQPQRVWCGTSGAGAWRSDDAGRSWRPLAGDLETSDVSAVAVAADEHVAYAGIDPSAMWRSEDGGRHWEELAQMRALPSAPSWSFPPQPETSHVRWITLDPAAPERLYVCIEAGALVRSSDGGSTWQDRVPDGPRDTHTLATHPDAPGRLYSAAGDGLGRPGRGYNESRDGGDSWEWPDQGIEHHYLFGLAVDPGDADTIVVSAADSPLKAHSLRAAESTIYRKSREGAWHEVFEGLPEPVGSVRALLATNADEPGVFYAANNHGVFRSPDAGLGWEPVLAPLPDPFRDHTVHAIAITP